MKPVSKLRAVKSVHTAIWAAFAGCILAIPICTYANRLDISSVLIAVVSIEVLIIAFNHLRCPLTNVAARYTDDRSDNFDIYLPVWLAKHNKLIFGALFMVGSLYTLLVWVAGHGAT